jgi:hypothetical protein
VVGGFREWSGKVVLRGGEAVRGLDGGGGECWMEEGKDAVMVGFIEVVEVCGVTEYCTQEPAAQNICRYL